jgi:hypothetical protein
MLTIIHSLIIIHIYNSILHEILIKDHTKSLLRIFAYPYK